MAYGKKLTFGRELHHSDTLRPEAHPPPFHQPWRGAGIDTGGARRPIVDFDTYEQSLKARMDPTANILRSINTRARAKQARMIFAEGDDSRVLRAAVAYVRAGMGEAVVVGRQDDVRAKLAADGIEDALGEIEIVNAANTEHFETYKAFLYDRLQRDGHDAQDVHRLAARDRHVFSALMLAHGHGDALVTGATRKSASRARTHQPCLRCPRRGRGRGGDRGAPQGPGRSHSPIRWCTSGLTRRTLPISRSRGADVARMLGLEPRVAFVSFSTFGYPRSERAEKMHKAPEVLDTMGVDFEYEGDMTVDVALNMAAMAAYPFSATHRHRQTFLSFRRGTLPRFR